MNIDLIDRLALRRLIPAAFFGWIVFPALSMAALPAAYPAVQLREDSSPRYAAVNLDPWGRNTAYLLFDGDQQNGYPRMYVWIPGDARYGTPVAMMAGQENRYPPLRLRVEGDADEAAEVVWNLRWGYHHSGGGGGVNYYTGEQVSARPRSRHARISYEVNYARERRNVRGSRLALTIPGTLSFASEWDGAPRPQVPWEAINISLSVNRVLEQDQIALRMGSRFYHQSNRIVVVETIPDAFFDVQLSVSPYLKPAIYREDVPFESLLRSGVRVPVEPRWYSIAWTCELHPWMGGHTRRGSHFMPVAR